VHTGGTCMDGQITNGGMGCDPLDRGRGMHRLFEGCHDVPRQLHVLEHALQLVGELAAALHLVHMVKVEYFLLTGHHTPPGSGRQGRA
jgi:hypothetical protein